MEEEATQRGLRILLMGSFPPQAQGISGYCGALATALAQHHEVHALGFKSMYPSWLFPGVKTTMDETSTLPAAPNLTVRHCLTWYNPLGWVWSALRAPVDVMHIQWWSLPLAPVCFTLALVAKIRGIPVAVTAHNVRPHEASPWFLRASRLLFRLADHVLVHSESNREQLLSESSLKPKQVTQVPMGCPVDTLPRPSQAEARETLGLAPHLPTLLFFGTIRPYKGLRDLLQAFVYVLGVRPDVQLVVAGKPWESWAPYQKIIDTAGIGGAIHLRLDYIPEAEVGHYFAAADLVVLPYRHFDAQSAVGGQSLGYETPLLVSQVGGLSDLVDGDPAWIVPSGNIEALSDALNGFLADVSAARLRFQSVADRSRDALSWAASLRVHDQVYRTYLHADRSED